MSLSEQMAMEDEIEELRDQLCRILLSVPTTTMAFDGNIPLYVKTAFDSQQDEIDRLRSENSHLHTQVDFLKSELMKFVNAALELSKSAQ